VEPAPNGKDRVPAAGGGARARPVELGPATVA
jgi:hypothetical protein